MGRKEPVWIIIRPCTPPPLEKNGGNERVGKRERDKKRFPSRVKNSNADGCPPPCYTERRQPGLVQTTQATGPKRLVGGQTKIKIPTTERFNHCLLRIGT